MTTIRIRSRRSHRCSRPIGDRTSRRTIPRNGRSDVSTGASVRHEWNADTRVPRPPRCRSFPRLKSLRDRISRGLQSPWVCGSTSEIAAALIPSARTGPIRSSGASSCLAIGCPPSRSFRRSRRAALGTSPSPVTTAPSPTRRTSSDRELQGRKELGMSTLNASRSVMRSALTALGFGLVLATGLQPRAGSRRRRLQTHMHHRPAHRRFQLACHVGRKRAVRVLPGVLGTPRHDRHSDRAGRRRSIRLRHPQCATRRDLHGAGLGLQRDHPVVRRRSMWGRGPKDRHGLGIAQRRPATPQ